MQHAHLIELIEHAHDLTMSTLYRQDSAQPSSAPAAPVTVRSTVTGSAAGVASPPAKLGQYAQPMWPLTGAASASGVSMPAASIALAKLNGLPAIHAPPGTTIQAALHNVHLLT